MWSRQHRNYEGLKRRTHSEDSDDEAWSQKGRRHIIIACATTLIHAFMQSPFACRRLSRVESETRRMPGRRVERVETQHEFPSVHHVQLHFH